MGASGMLVVPIHLQVLMLNYGIWKVIRNDDKVTMLATLVVRQGQKFSDLGPLVILAFNASF